MATDPRFVLLSHEQLVPDPDNPRRFYPPDDVAAMAESIRDGGGVEVPLLVQTRPELGSMYQVIDGHFRLAGASTLGLAAPLLKCEVRSGLSRRDTLLIMARTSALWFAKDPVSEAKHYRKLLDGDPPMTITALSRATGLSDNLIASRLRLLDLDPEIQEYVADGRLSKVREVADALLSIKDRTARLRLASELAKRKASIRGVELACERLRGSLESRTPPHGGSGPKLPRSLEILERSGGVPAAGREVGPHVRPAAAAACASCDIKAELLAHVPEPAWALVSHVAGDTCANCSLQDVRDACAGCPLPEFLMRLAKDADAPAPPAVLEIASPNGRKNGGHR